MQEYEIVIVTTKGERVIPFLTEDDEYVRGLGLDAGPGRLLYFPFTIDQDFYIRLGRDDDDG